MSKKEKKKKKKLSTVSTHLCFLLWICCEQQGLLCPEELPLYQALLPLRCFSSESFITAPGKETETTPGGKMSQRKTVSVSFCSSSCVDIIPFLRFILFYFVCTAVCRCVCLCPLCVQCPQKGTLESQDWSYDARELLRGYKVPWESRQCLNH